MKDILLVTFPVDLGNRTIESNLHQIFAEDMDFFRFAKKHADNIDYKRIGAGESVKYRFQSATELRKVVSSYSKKGKYILFNGLSPALFAYGCWDPRKTAISLDWTRTLYPSILGNPIKKDFAFYLHKKVLTSCPKILCSTDALLHNLQDVYGVKKSNLYKVPVPFMVDNLNIPPRPTPMKPKVLFVGGDLKRKGGDILLNQWDQLLRAKCSLSMMTNDRSTNVDGVQYLSGIKYGSDIHKKIFEEHDILVLPTRIDSYPQVIGEAAAAGLAVVTTKFALASNEVIKHEQTGYIAESSESCVNYLNTLLDDYKLIDSFKNKGYKLMLEKFDKSVIRSSYLNVLNI